MSAMRGAIILGVCCGINAGLVASSPTPGVIGTAVVCLCMFLINLAAVASGR